MKEKKIMKRSFGTAVILTMALAMAACSDDKPAASESPAPTAVATASASPEPTTTATPVPTAAPSAVSTASPEPSSSPSGDEDIQTENNAFRIISPLPNSEVGKSFKVTGEARVFEAAFSYSFEDGHNVLAEGNVMADMGAPEWGKFEFTVNIDRATNPTGLLFIYEISAKDGKPVNQLVIPFKFSKDVIKSQP